MTSIDTPPAFIGVGAGKCGTTWLTEMLRLHPSIFVPEVKELHYFNDLTHELSTRANPVASRPIEWYLSQFDDAPTGALCGEFSTHYLWNETAPRRIWKFNRETKIVMVLRDPVQRLHSVYLFAAQRGYLKLGQTFEETLDEFPHMVDRSRYGAAMARFLTFFPREQIHVAFHSDLTRDPAAEVMKLHGFLGVDPRHPIDTDRRVNVTGTPRHPRVARLLWQVRGRARYSPMDQLVSLGKRLGLQDVYHRLRQTEPFIDKPRILPETERHLRHLLADDVAVLEELLETSFPSWKPATGSPVSHEV